ncbi:uncharacterized protein LOC116420354 [Sarcophilus harrisii]|uniref:uncharacterized protein LOC116420354 n=1 Tax=Sarcophilus harrisii TaxID=9305 RepID=UPI001301CB6A|nr:uncharacterized protein LOC116420354 [Sarcophilus harrisii]
MAPTSSRTLNMAPVARLTAQVQSAPKSGTSRTGGYLLKLSAPSDQGQAAGLSFGPLQLPALDCCEVLRSGRGPIHPGERTGGRRGWRTPSSRCKPDDPTVSPLSASSAGLPADRINRCPESSRAFRLLRESAPSRLKRERKRVNVGGSERRRERAPPSANGAPTCPDAATAEPEPPGGRPARAGKPASQPSAEITGFQWNDNGRPRSSSPTWGPSS